MSRIGENWRELSMEADTAFVVKMAHEEIEDAAGIRNAGEDESMRTIKSYAFPMTVSSAQLAEAANAGELQALPTETPEEYRAFLEYCAMGPSARLEDVGKVVGLSKSGISRMRNRRHWAARIERWWFERNGQTAVFKEGSDSKKRQDALRNEEWLMHAEVIAASREALRRWKASDDVPSLIEIARVLELASKLGRLAAGLPLMHTEVIGNLESPIRVQVEAALARVYGSPG